MKIKKITSQYRNDFHADMECEFCDHVEKLTTGYNDGFYHTRVIPRMACPNCGHSTDEYYPQPDGSSDGMGRRSVTP